VAEQLMNRADAVAGLQQVSGEAVPSLYAPAGFQSEHVVPRLIARVDAATVSK